MTHLNLTLAERVARLEEQMEQALDGVSNFKKFQLDTTQKIGFVYGFSKTVAWIVGIIAPILISLLIWFLTQFAIPAGKLILEDYYKHHPQANIIYQENIDSEMPKVEAKESGPPPQKSISIVPQELR